MYIVSDVLNESSFVSTFFFFQKKRKSQHPLLFKNQTKSKKDAHQVTRLGPDPLSRAFLHWHRGEVQTSKTTHQSLK